MLGLDLRGLRWVISSVEMLVKSHDSAILKPLLDLGGLMAANLTLSRYTGERLGLLSQHLSGQRAAVVALVNDHHTVDDDVGDAHGVLVRVNEGRPVGDGLSIE